MFAYIKYVLDDGGTSSLSDKVIIITADVVNLLLLLLLFIIIIITTAVVVNLVLGPWAAAHSSPYVNPVLTILHVAANMFNEP